MINRHCSVAFVAILMLGVSSRALCQTTPSADSAVNQAVSIRRAESVLPAKDLLSDVAILRRVFETLHPGLYRYNTPEQIEAAFRSLEVQFQQDRTLSQAYLACSLFAAKLKCGHTYPNFFNQPKSIAAELFQEPRLPFYFQWLGDRLIVTQSFAADERIRKGTELLAINSVPVSDILKRLMSVARADGNNDAKRVAYLQVGGECRYEAFDIYWPMFFPSSSPEVTLDIRSTPGSETETISAAKVAYTDRVALIDKQAGADAGESNQGWEFHLHDGHIGILRMPSWVMYNSKWKWRSFLNETFDDLADSNATDLVIDLRGNEGGSNVGDVIVSHLISSPVPRQAVTRLVRYRKVPVDLLPYLHTWDPSFKDWGAAAIEPIDRFYRLRRTRRDDKGSLIKPTTPRFPGRLWILVDANNSSATFEFAQTVQQNKLGLLVGQPTGGNQRGINGGAFFFLRLPSSGIEFDIPLIGQFRQEDAPDAGLQPDIFVLPTVSDIALGRDAAMEAVLSQINGNANELEPIVQ